MNSSKSDDTLQKKVTELEQMLSITQEQLVDSKQKLGNALNAALDIGGDELWEKIFSRINDAAV